jgi:thioredoxin-like negative regulator of GroEL
VVSKEADHAEQVPAADPVRKAKLVFFFSERSGRSRRVEGFLAQVLQRRRNHETFELVRVSVERHPELAARFEVTESPTICIVEGRRLRKRIVDPRGCRQLESERALAEWLR